jgi:hypothetical protein
MVMECVFGRPTARGPSEARRKTGGATGKAVKAWFCACEPMEIHRISIVKNYDWLVVWNPLEHEIYDFSFSWEFHHPN